MSVKLTQLILTDMFMKPSPDTCIYLIQFYGWFLIYLNQILDNRKGVSKTGQQFSEWIRKYQRKEKKTCNSYSGPAEPSRGNQANPV